MRPVLLIDFGSTYTKVTAADADEGKLLGTAAAYTTVQTDINDGLDCALRELEKQTGKLTYSARYACSSAAGGLRMADYLATLEQAAKPFHLRIEGPMDVEEREGQMQALKALTAELDKRHINVEIVADEWCNTLEDIKYFADNKAGHMRDRLTAQCGVTPRVYVYPYGQISDGADAALRALGFEATLSCYERVTVLRRGDPDCLYSIGRYNRPAGPSSEEFFRRILRACAAAE